MNATCVRLEELGTKFSSSIIAQGAKKVPRQGVVLLKRFRTYQGRVFIGLYVPNHTGPTTTSFHKIITKH